ncbi:MAG: sensor domain-containing diguanylate cyclase [Jatrophihabitantaceae bacterium]
MTIEQLRPEGALRHAEPGSDPLPVLDAGVGSRLSPSELRRAAERLLARYPDAAIAAIGESGLFQPMPTSVPVHQHPVIHGHVSALELVAQSDYVAVIEAWKRTLACGLATVEAHPIAAAEATMRWHFIDSRAEYGVLLGLVVHSGSALDVDLGIDNPLRPRVSVVRKNGVAEFTELDGAFELLLGYPAGQLIGQRNLELVHPDDHPRALANWMDMLGSPGGSRRVRLRQRHRDGHWIWFEITNHNLLNDPDQRCVVAEMIDISEEMATQESLRANEQLLLRLTESLPVGVLQLGPDRAVVHRNQRVAQILGAQAAGSFAGLLAGLVKPDRAPLDSAVTLALQQAQDTDLEVSAQRPGGELLRCRISVRALLGEDGQPSGAIVCFDDVTEPARLREQLEVRATYDALTGCYNRASILQALERSLAQASPDRGGVAVIFLDLDGFKAVNDQRGHAEGDARLKQIGGCLAEALRHGDVVGRFGGDEFLVVSSGVSSPEQALALGERLAGALAHEVELTPPARAVASIGIGWTDGQHVRAGVTADLLVAQADTAMYESKHEGIGRPVLAGS